MTHKHFEWLSHREEMRTVHMQTQMPISAAESNMLSVERRARETSSSTLPTLELVDTQSVKAGFEERANQFTRILAEPYAISDALVSIGPKLDRAVDYYRTQSPEQVATDVSGAIEAIGAGVQKLLNLSGQQRGKLIGGLAFDVLVTDATAGVSLSAFQNGLKGLGLSETLAAKDHSHLPKELQEPLDSIDTRMESRDGAEPIGIKVMNLDASAEHADQVQRIMDELPHELQNLLIRNRVQIRAVDRIENFVKNHPNTRGLMKLDQNTMYIADRFERAGVLMSEPQTLDRIVRHEIGHVIDSAGTNVLSQQKPIFDAYMKCVKRLTGSQRRALEYYTTGNAKGAQETFAEIYAQTKTASKAADSAHRMQFATAFPELFEAVRMLNLP